jgi:hypothetical protein
MRRGLACRNVRYLPFFIKTVAMRASDISVAKEVRPVPSSFCRHLLFWVLSLGTVTNINGANGWPPSRGFLSRPDFNSKDQERMKNLKFASTLIAVAALSACGGGGGEGTPSAATPTPTPTQSVSPVTGSVSAPFQAGANPGYFLMGVGLQSTGTPSPLVQEASGAVTTISSYTLGGTKVVRDISGNASFAMGRWAAGTMTSRTSAIELTESSNASTHYLVLNRPVAALPASGTLACDAGAFTTPSSNGSVSVGAANYLGSATGTASLTFGGGGAALAATIQIHNSNSSGTGNFSVQLSDSVIGFSGQSLGTGATGAFLGLGDGGDGSYLIGGSYTVKLASGAGYIGAFKFRCHS